jgi:hypothetical protein
MAVAATVGSSCAEDASVEIYVTRVTLRGSVTDARGKVVMVHGSNEWSILGRHGVGPHDGWWL